MLGDASAAGLFPGKSAHVELRELVSAGLRPYEALTAGTRSPGAFISRHVETTRFGTLTVGSKGDVMVVRGNPLEDVANAAAVEGVLVRGVWFTSADLRQLRDAAAHAQ